MAVRTRAREVETVLPKIVEHLHAKADYRAREHNGTLIGLESLPPLLKNPGFVNSIKNTKSYKRKGYIAPAVVVVEQAQASSQAKPTKAANGVVVPSEKFNAAKEAFRKVEPTMRPDLADAFKAVFGE